MYAEIKIHLNDEDVKNCIREKFGISENAHIELEALESNNGRAMVHASFNRNDASAKIIFEEAAD